MAVVPVVLDLAVVGLVAVVFIRCDAGSRSDEDRSEVMAVIRRCKQAASPGCLRALPKYRKPYLKHGAPTSQAPPEISDESFELPLPEAAVRRL